MNLLANILSATNDLAHAWFAWMVPLSLQLLVLVAVVYLIDRLLGRRAWPQLLCALWLLVMLKLVLPPSLGSPTSLANLAPRAAVESVQAELGWESNVAAAVSQHTQAVEASLSVVPAVGTAPAFPVSDTLPLVCFLLWALGCCALAARGLIAHHRLRRQLASAECRPLSGRLEQRCQELSLQLGLRKQPRVVRTSLAMGPAVFGALRPVIVLPDVLLKCMSAEELDHVLLHELSHVKRRDGLVELICTLLAVVYWFHPGVWIARRRLATVRELCCDDSVARCLSERADGYRRTLLALSQPLWAAAGIPFLRRSQLVERLEHLGRCGRRPNPARRLVTLSVVAVVAACLLPMAPVQGQQPVSDLAQEEQPNEAPAATESEADKNLAESIARSSLPPGEDLQPVSYELPSLDDVEGCLQRRYVVMAAMAQQAQAEKP